MFKAIGTAGHAALVLCFLCLVAQLFYCCRSAWKRCAVIGFDSILLTRRVHIRAVALDLLTDALLPPSDLSHSILFLAALLWEDISEIDLLFSATEILPGREARLLQGWTARQYPDIYRAFLQRALDA